jgi:hypothetical protein
MPLRLEIANLLSNCRDGAVPRRTSEYQRIRLNPRDLVPNESQMALSNLTCSSRAITARDDGKLAVTGT